jgi:hypothetical protein
MEIGAALWVLLALAVGIIAAREFGRSGIGWFLLALLLTPLAGLLLFLLPPRRQPCPFCAELVRPSANVCRYCGRSLPGLSERAGLPLWTRLILLLLVLGVLAAALSQCDYQFQWWRNGKSIQI